MTLTATEKYKTAEAKVKEAFNLSEIGDSIFQQQTQVVGKRSRSNSKILIQSGKEDSYIHIQTTTGDETPVPPHKKPNIKQVESLQPANDTNALLYETVSRDQNYQHA